MVKVNGDEKREMELQMAERGELIIGEDVVKASRKYGMKYGVRIDVQMVRRLMKNELAKARCEACEGLDKCESGGILMKYEVEGGELHEYVYRCRKLESRWRRNKWRLAYEEAGLSKAYDGMEMNEKQKLASQKVEAGLMKGRSVYVYGEVGIGKTLAVTRVSEKLIRKGEAVRFYNAAELIMGLCGSESRRWYEEAMKAGIMVIDDIGTEYVSEWSLERLFMLIDGRYRQGGGTIYTSNMSVRQLKGRYGKVNELMSERIVNRLERGSEIIMMR